MRKTSFYQCFAVICKYLMIYMLQGYDKILIMKKKTLRDCEKLLEELWLLCHL